MAFDLNELNNLDLENVGDWPMPVKIGLTVILCAIILIAGFYFLNVPQLDQLKKEQRTERELKAEFSRKQTKAANLDAYRQQIIEIKKTFGTLLRKLPDKTEVPGLLEDISTAGVTSGLRVEVFKPLPERELGFYAELPIEMTVTGSYHQLGEFVSKLSALDRIVTVHDFTIRAASASANTRRGPSQTAIENQGNVLRMSLLAKTYRYQDDEGGIE